MYIRQRIIVILEREKIKEVSLTSYPSLLSGKNFQATWQVTGIKAETDYLPEVKDKTRSPRKPKWL